MVFEIKNGHDVKDISRLARSRLVQATLMTLVLTKVIHGDPRQQSTQEFEYVTAGTTILRKFRKFRKFDQNFIGSRNSLKNAIKI